MPGPWTKYASGNADPVIAPPDPYKQQSAANEQTRIGIELERLRLAQQKAARDRQEAEVKQTKFENSKRTAIAETKRVINALKGVRADANDNGGWFETGRSGAFMRDLPGFMKTGTAAYDLANRIKGVNAQAAIQALTEMRANSPTGGAVGNVSEGEYPILSASKQGVVLDPNVDHEAFMRDTKAALNAWEEQLRALEGRGAKAAPQSSGGWGKATVVGR